MITRILIFAMTLVLTLASCSKEEHVESADYSATTCMVVTDNCSRPLEIFSAISGVATDAEATPYSYSYSSSDGTFRISIEGSIEADDSNTYAVMKLKMPGEGSEKTIIFINSSHPASRADLDDVPVIMNQKQ